MTEIERFKKSLLIKVKNNLNYTSQLKQIVWQPNFNSIEIKHTYLNERNYNRNNLSFVQKILSNHEQLHLKIKN